MKCILKVGFAEIMLPSVSGIEALVKTLSKGVFVYSRLYAGQVEIREKKLTVEFELVPDSTVFIEEGGKTADPFQSATPPKPAKARALPAPPTQLRLVG